jgi:CrcB protein
MQELLSELLWVALGGVLGGTMRYFVSGLVARKIGETFPWGTLVVNATGAFAIGLVGSSLLQMPALWQFAVVGLLGSYTTVSSFSLQTLALARDGELLRASGNVVLSLLLCLSAVTLGIGAAAAIGIGAP